MQKNKRIPDDTVNEWRILKKQGWTDVSIAIKYGVSHHTVSRKLSEQVWC